MKSYFTFTHILCYSMTMMTLHESGLAGVYITYKEKYSQSTRPRSDVMNSFSSIQIDMCEIRVFVGFSPVLEILYQIKWFLNFNGFNYFTSFLGSIQKFTLNFLSSVILETLKLKFLQVSTFVSPTRPYLSFLIFPKLQTKKIVEPFCVNQKNPFLKLFSRTF